MESIVLTLVQYTSYESTEEEEEQSSCLEYHGSQGLQLIHLYVCIVSRDQNGCPVECNM